LLLLKKRDRPGKETLNGMGAAITERNMKGFAYNKSKLFWVLHISGWIVFAAIMAIYRSEIDFKTPKGFLLMFITYSTGFMITLGLRYFYQKIYPGLKSILSVLLVILVSSTFALIIWEPLDVSLSLIIWTREEWVDFINTYKPFTLVKYFKMNLIWYLFILIWSILYFGIKTWFVQMEERIRAEKAIAMANKAQLMMLRYQLNPHFLFNSLNSIQALMYKDVKKADLMLTELSEFLRYTLKHNTEVYVTLKDEFEIIEKYLFVEKIRFNDRLDYSINLSHELIDEKILCFLTQPFVENAIKHGMRSSPYNIVQVNMSAELEDDILVISITNTGLWTDNEDRKGTGIENVKERLNNAFPGCYWLNISQDENNVKVVIKVPRHE